MGEIRKSVELMLDEALELTFPASDPIAVHVPKPASAEVVDEPTENDPPAPKS